MSTSDDDGDGVPDGFQVDDDDRSDNPNAGGPLLSLDWGKVYNVPKPLREFAEAPVAFIVGTLLSYLLGGIEAIVASFLKAIDAVANAFVAVPRSAADILRQAGGGVGDTLLSAISGVLATFEGAAASAGPLGPVLGGLAVAGSIVVAAYAVRWLYNRLADAIVPL